MVSSFNDTELRVKTENIGWSRNENHCLREHQAGEPKNNNSFLFHENLANALRPIG